MKPSTTPASTNTLSTHRFPFTPIRPTRCLPQFPRLPSLLPSMPVIRGNSWGNLQNALAAAETPINSSSCTMIKENLSEPNFSRAADTDPRQNRKPNPQCAYSMPAGRRCRAFAIGRDSLCVNHSSSRRAQTLRARRVQLSLESRAEIRDQLAAAIAGPGQMLVVLSKTLIDKLGPRKNQRLTGAALLARAQPAGQAQPP